MKTAEILKLQPMEFWAFLETSDFERMRQGSLYRQDEVHLIRHDQRLDEDYALMVSIGCIGIRDAARWYVSHPAPHCFDWDWLDRVVESAGKHQLQLYLDLWHYGYPDWMDILADDAPQHFAEFAAAIADRYPSLKYYCVSNEPTLMVERAGRQGKWRPFLRGKTGADLLRAQICRMIVEASKAILAVRPDAVLVIPEPWHSTDEHRLHRADARSVAVQARIIDTVLGRREPELGGDPSLIHIIGLNHYRDTTLPPFHQMILKAQQHWPDIPLWLTETSGPPFGWRQNEWFWWMMAEINLARILGVEIPVFTWAPVISMYDWETETRHLRNGVWKLTKEGDRVPNDYMVQAIQLARDYGYLL
ncbi:MAG: beta-galactosidase [Chloroflexi bacterium]|nr:beta-galactosidase [Chloroflexota bacterium]